MAVLLLLVLLLIVLLWKCHSREGGKATTVLTHFAIQNRAFEENEPVHTTIDDTVARKTCPEIRSQHNGTQRYVENHSHIDETCIGNKHCVDIHSQHIKSQENEDYTYEEIPHGGTADNENYTMIQLQHDGTQENEDYEPVDITISTQHTEAQGNGSYQTIATVVSTEPHTAYDESAVHDGTVDSEDDYEEYAEPDYQPTATANSTEHIKTNGNGAYQTIIATANSTQPNATYGDQVDDQWDYEENVAYGGRVDNQHYHEEYYDELRFQ